MSLIQYIKKLYINDIITNSEYLTKYTSCEITSIYIIDKLKKLNLITYSKTFFNINELKNIHMDIETFLIEVILYRRSHTFIIVKEKDKTYLVSSYLNLYTSYVKEIDNFYLILKNLYKIEYEDNVILHNDLFNTSNIPCLNLDKSYSKIKINLYLKI